MLYNVFHANCQGGERTKKAITLLEDALYKELEQFNELHIINPNGTNKIKVLIGFSRGLHYRYLWVWEGFATFSCVSQVQSDDARLLSLVENITRPFKKELEEIEKASVTDDYANLWLTRPLLNDIRIDMDERSW